MTSGSFGSFKAGKIYIVELLLHGSFESFGSGNPASIKLADVLAPGVSPVINFGYIVSSGSSSRNGSSVIENNISARVTVDGTSVTSDFQLQATITVMDSTSATGFDTAGNYLSIQVGAIG